MSDLDPKHVASREKPSTRLLPPTFLFEVNAALEAGAASYGEYNWRHSDGVMITDYTDAIERHKLAILDGALVDAKSGASHFAHIAATCAIMLDALAHGKLIDNRPAVLAERLAREG